MTHLDEKALEAAYSESGAHPWASSGEQCEKFLNAYLSALPSSPVSELVERLNGENPDKVVATDRLRMYAHDPDTFEFDQHDALSLIPIIEEAASTLTSLSTRNAELEREVKRLREALTDVEKYLDGEPEYHSQGMGCGLEDRCITDRYEAMEHGWEQAMERVYAEHINHAREVTRRALTPGRRA